MTFSPSSGTFNGPQTIKLSNSTQGSIIHYTTNGSTPTTSSPRYTAPIKINQSETIKAIAFASGHTPSFASQGAYIIK